MVYSLSKSGQDLKGLIELGGSKSISNRLLIIRALSNQSFDIQHLASAADTVLLQDLLSKDAEVYDCGPAGTCFRFLTAYFALKNKSCVLTGSDRMKQRPIGPLVDALRSLGFHIAYLEKDGFPPLKIGGEVLGEIKNEVAIDSSISSQFISALLLIGPMIPGGLTLKLDKEVVSISYIEMTCGLMKAFGVEVEKLEKGYFVPGKGYEELANYRVEADWSAASYYYGFGALGANVDLQLNGLFEDSFQGDSILPKLYESFGVLSEFNESGVRLMKQGESANTSKFAYNFDKCPDIAQTLAVTCALRNVEGEFSGLSTLKNKETDRMWAVKRELEKISCGVVNLDDNESVIEGNSGLDEGQVPFWETYHDHRMAMAFSATALVFDEVKIEDPLVVGKSYPEFWEDLKKLGFEVKEIED